MPKLPTKPLVSVDGVLNDWISSERIDNGDLAGYNFYADAQGSFFYFALAAPIVIGPNTTFWFNTDQNTATGYQIFGFAGGAEYNVNIKSDGTAAVYSGAAGETLVLDNIQIAYSADHQAVEFAIPKTALGNPEVIKTLFDINDTVFGPSNYSAQPYVAYNNDIVRTDPTRKIGIVYSATTAAHYFSQTAYSQLFMAMQSQAMQAGISFDVLTESDLSNLAKLANYDALVFPSFANVQASQVTAITDTLLQATKQFGIGLITAGNFMTNDETGAALAGDSYARMKLLFDATRVTGGFPADVTVTSSDTNKSVFKTMTAGDVIHNYTGVAWDAFQSVSGAGQTIATETVGTQTYAAALATQTGGKNVLFSTGGVMADSNLLWQAIDYAANDPGVSLSLEISRFKGIVASRTDMDQAMFTEDVSPGNGTPGIYDLLLPILAQWKAQYNFVGSYYVDIGNNPAAGETTNWAVSAPYYAQILALGNELGTHSLTHPEDTNVLTAAQIQTEFQQSKLLIEQQMSAYLGSTFTVTGAAVPGATETLPTAQDIIQYFTYITGGFSGVGSGYPGAFGYLTPDLTNSVYLAPNTSFDFTLAEFQRLGAAGAAAAWATEWNQLTANANLPIVLWPWHDYGPTAWQTNPPIASPYTLQMYTDWIQRAFQSGAEFVTEADLAARIVSFDKSGVTSSVSGNLINVTITSAHAGNFALDIGGTSGQVIQNVANWYAYDSNQLFLPETGGSYTITLGATQDDVTHIASLPMRGDLISVTGDGLNLGFSVVGEGDLIIDLGAGGNRTPFLTGAGASIVSLTGDKLDVRLAGLGAHDVSLRMLLPPPVEFVSAIAFSQDTGASATDLVTNAAAQTVTGTLTAPLAAGDVVQVSMDNGVTWLNAIPTAGGGGFALSGILLAGSGTVMARVVNSDGVPNVALSRTYVLDTTPPVAPGTPDLADASDSGSSATDNITKVTTPTFSGIAEAGATVTLFDAATAIGTAVASSTGAWTIVATPLANGTHGISATATDVAGNTGAVSAALTVVVDTVAPAAPSLPDLATASDSGVSSTDNVTRITAPTFAGSAEAGASVALFDAATAIGTAVASPTGAWTIVAAALANGTHAISATATDVAGNTAVSAVLTVVVDTVAPAAPSIPDLITASDTGVSSTDNLTRITTPTFAGTAEAGATVTLFDAATAIGTAVASATGTWTIVAAALANGTHAIRARQTDLAGNAGVASAALAVTIDTVAPAAPSQPNLATASDSGVSNTDNLTNVAAPVFTGTAVAGSTVTLLDGTIAVGSAIATAGGTWSITAAPLANGAHAIAATATDPAGNAGAASTALAVTIDTTAPAAPLLTGGSAVSLFGISTFTLSGTGEAGDTVTFLNGTASAGTATVGSGGNWSWQFIGAATAQTLTAVQTDRAGNKGAASGLAVIGTSGANTLSGGAGNDLFLGGAGIDTFTFSGAFAKDIIADFAATGTAHDIINFRANATLNSFAAVLSHAVQVGTGVVITQDASNTLTLGNASRASLTAADFRFV